MPADDFWSCLGLTRYEQDLYQALVSDAVTPVEELAAARGLPVDEVPAVVRALTDAHLVTTVAGRVEALEPRVAVLALARRRQATLDQRTAVAAGLAEVYSRARADQAPADAQLRMLRGPEATRIVVQALDSATRSIDALVGPPVATEHQASNAEYNALQRGVVIRSIVDASLLSSESIQDNLTMSAALGEELRWLPNLRDKMLIIDRSTVILPLALADEHTRAAVSEFAPLAETLQRYFDLQWERARPVGPSAPLPADPARRRDAHLEDLLRLGLSDTAMCRHLGVSDRTLRRRIQDLCLGYGVTTRVQLGLAMAEATADATARRTSTARSRT